MSLTDSHIQFLYDGYLNTYCLWKSNSILGLQQFELDSDNRFSLFRRKLHKKLRLGQLAEQFVFNELEQFENCKILAENIQVQKDKQTLGELDALIEFNTKRIHLEIVYKFYLFDASLGTSEIAQWIGPNRNDSLIEKLKKLRNKQLPLLYSEDCHSTLKSLNLNAEDFQQKILFKAQLFSPYKSLIKFKLINEHCLSGFYLNLNQLEDFSFCKFFIPSKLDWFLEPHTNVFWLDYISIKTEVIDYLKQNKSPLLWIKQPDSTLQKCFLVWW